MIEYCDYCVDCGYPVLNNGEEDCIRCNVSKTRTHSRLEQKNVYRCDACKDRLWRELPDWWHMDEDGFCLCGRCWKDLVDNMSARAVYKYGKGQGK